MYQKKILNIITWFHFSVVVKVLINHFWIIVKTIEFWTYTVVVNNMPMVNKKLSVKIFLNQLLILIIFMVQGHLLKKHTVKTKLILEQFVLLIMYNQLKKNMSDQVWDRDIQLNLPVVFNKTQQILIYNLV